MELPWTVQFVQRRVEFVSVLSALRMRGMVLRSERERSRRQFVQIEIKRPFRAKVWIREPGSDLSTFREVVMTSLYAGICERVSGAEYILDLGANIGLASLYFASRFPSAKIFAVEAASENYHVLEKNLHELKTVGRAELCFGAAWDTDGMVNVGSPPSGHDYDAIQVSSDVKCSGQPVAAHSIASLIKLSKFPRIDILKMDIEGAEETIFNGSTQWLKDVNGLAIEFHGQSRAKSNFDSVASAAGFVVEDDKFRNTVLAFRRPVPSGKIH